MNDNTFYFEEKLLNTELEYVDDLSENDVVPREKYKKLVDEYERLLIQTEHITSISYKVKTALTDLRQEVLGEINMDKMTGMYNRHYLFKSFERYYKDSLRAQKSLAVMQIDIDYFKRYNKLYGNIKGDECIKEVAHIISGSVERVSDFTARYSGQEFFIVLPFVDQYGVKTVAERMINNIHQAKIKHANSPISDYVTISIGITSALLKYDKDNNSNISPESFFKTANDAAYIAKTQGRDRYVYLEIEND